MNSITIIVTRENRGKRLDAFIAGSSDYTRNSVQLLMDRGNVFVNCKICSKSYKVKENDEIVINVPPARDMGIIAQDIPLDIYYEDDDLLVVNKPKGMVVHPANGNESGTLVNALMYHCKGSLSGINGEIRPGIVHRIDKDTSGLLVVAKNDKAHEGLAAQFKEHSVTRVYNAIVYGNLKDDEGDIDAPIGRHKTDRKKFCVTEVNSKSAFTHYKVLERLKGFTLIECRLKTGRTHQIRVHMQSIGHPLAGDPVYGPKNIISELDGQALHRGVIGFVHPIKKEYMEFSAPWCSQFQKFYDKVKIK